MSIQTYLKKRGAIVDVNVSSDQYEMIFSPVEDINSSNRKEYFEDNSFYIEGAILFSVDGLKVLDYVHWDLVDQLWAYLINGLYEIIIEEFTETKFYFPDQPLEVRLKGKGKSLFIQVGGASFIEISSELINVCLEARKFLSHLSMLTGNDYEESFEKINEILEHL